jgi:hypothetical protein
MHVCLVVGLKCLRHLDQAKGIVLELVCLLGLTLGLVRFGLGSLKLGRLALWALSFAFSCSLSLGLSLSRAQESLNTIHPRAFGFVFTSQSASVSRRIRGEASPGLRLRVDAKFARNGCGLVAWLRQGFPFEVSGPYRTYLTMVIG